MKQIAIECKIKKYRGCRRFVISKNELFAKLKPIIDNEKLFTFIEEYSKDAIGSHDTRTLINVMIQCLYDAKNYLQKNSMDDYKWVDSPIKDLNLYFSEMENVKPETIQVEE